MPLYGKEQDLPGFVILFCYSAAKNEFFRFLFYARRKCKFGVHILENKTYINGIIDADGFAFRVRKILHIISDQGSSFRMEITPPFTLKQCAYYRRIPEAPVFTAAESGRFVAVQIIFLYIFLPQPTADNILPMDDRFMDGEFIDLSKYKAQDFVAGIMKDYNLDQIQHIQVCKQADCLVLFYLLEDQFAPEVKRASWDYYIERTLHDSSLSLSTHSVMAADMGDEEMAYDLFQKSCAIDLGPYMGTSDAGIHAASFGGIWQCVVYGFGGVRMLDGKLRIEPRLPANWNKLSYTLYWKGEKLAVTVTKDDVEIQNLTGNKQVELTVRGKTVVI